MHNNGMYSVKDFFRDGRDFARLDYEKIEPVSDKKYILLAIQSIVLAVMFIPGAVALDMYLEGYKFALALGLVLAAAGIMLIKKWKLKLFKREAISFNQFYLIIFAFLLIAFIDPILEDLNHGITANQAALDQASASYSLWLSLIINALVPAVLEELIFRGLLLKGLFRNRYWLGLVITSAAFSWMHGPTNPVEFITYAYSGFIFGWIYLKTDRLEASMLLHLINNGMVVLLPTI